MEQAVREPISGYGYESMVWVRDSEGHEFSCTLENLRRGVDSIADLTESEKKSCFDVNQLIGTERW